MLDQVLLVLLVGATVSSVVKSAAVTYGPPTVPSTGGPAGCYLQIVQTPVVEDYFCATHVTIHLNYGTQTAPSNVYELRSYSVDESPSTPEATLVNVRNITLDIANQDEQTVALSPCFNISKAGGLVSGITA